MAYAREGPRMIGGGLAPWQARPCVAAVAQGPLRGFPGRAARRLCGLSRSYFTRAFKVSMGTPPHRWLLRERVRRAGEMLERTDESISAIALELRLRRPKPPDPDLPRDRRRQPGRLAAPAQGGDRAALHKRPLLTHIGVAVIGRRAQGLVVACKPDAAPKGVFELNTAATRSKGLGGRKGRRVRFCVFRVAVE